jgi:hypothetical protein
MGIARRAYEGFINAAAGPAYYRRCLAPKISAEGARWRGRWNGKRACLVLSYDPDEKEDMKQLPSLLGLLRKHRLTASFAVIGMLVEQDPSAYREILRHGHEIINHTYSHPDHPELNPDRHFHKITYAERLEEIRKCHAVIKERLKYECRGFRIPHFGNQFSPDIYRALNEVGYRFSSSTMAVRTKTHGFPYRVEGIFEFPMVCCATHPFCILDTAHAFRSRFARHDPEEYLESFERLLDFGIEHSMFINLYQDPQDLDKFDYGRMLSLIAARRKDLWITNYGELTEYLEA